jgi:ribonuclease HI
LAVREGLTLAKDLTGQKFQIATDCANVVKSLRGNWFGELVIRDHRSSNINAHMLAKSSIYNFVGKHV